MKNKQRIRLLKAAVLIGVSDIVDTTVCETKEVIKVDGDKFTEENDLNEGEVFL